MIRDPTTTDESGIPFCYGDILEESEGCKKCPGEIKSRCLEETDLEATRDPDLLDPMGKPDCFGKHYSEYSRKCTKMCDFAIQCSSKCKSNKVTSLPVLNNKPTSVRDPYKMSPFTFTSSTPQPPKETSYIVGPTGKPFLSEEKSLALYGRKPHPNPLVIGQFDGEKWYERLMKEFVLNTLKHAVTVMGNLVVDMLSRIRWAPKDKDERDG